MKQSEQIELLAAALVEVQKTPLLAARGAENPYFKSKYADLVEVWRVAREVLPKNNIAVVQAPFYAADGDGRFAVGVTTLLLHSPSGQWMSGDVGMNPAKTDAQAIGSCITYARRYGLASMVGIVSPGEDDDGNAASSTPEPAAEPEPDEIVVGKALEPDPEPGNPVPTLEPFNKGPRAPTPTAEQSSLASPWWKTVVIPFGKNKGSALGNLPKPTIFGWWANWQPRPYKGRISEVDAQLRKALDMAGIYYKFSLNLPDDGSPPF